jgi:hypothetical protein
LNPRDPERSQADWCLLYANNSRLAPCLARRPRQTKVAVRLVCTFSLTLEEFKAL